MKKILFTIPILSFCKKTYTIDTACKVDVIQDCICTMEYKAVFGCDGKTYGNVCLAKCAGVKTWPNGASAVK